MLSDYRRYLTGIRDSFIQNGVELEVKNVEDYSDIFYLGEKLSLLSWYFSVLAIGGSPDSLHGFIFPLNSFYMGKVRDKYFEDYLLFKAGYMQISKSETMKRLNIVEPTNKVVSEAKVSESEPEDIVEEVKEKFEVADIPVVDEDGFIIYTTNGVIDNKVDNEIDADLPIEEIEEEEVAEWGSYQEDEEVAQDYEEEDDDTFSNWGSSDEEDDEEDADDFVVQDYIEDGDFISQEYEEENDDFVTQEYELSEYDEDTLFGTWGDSDEDVIDDSSEGDSFDEDEELFKEWGSDSEEDEFEEEYVEEDSSEEDLFSSWGDSEDEELEQEYDDSLDDEEFFGSWGSSDDEDSEDISTDDSYDEDLFANWGNLDEDEDFLVKKPTKFDENRGSVFSSYGGVGEAVSNGTINVTPKSKEDYLIESNEEVLQNIEKLTGFMSKGLSKGGSLLKSKVTEIFKNSDDL